MNVKVKTIVSEMSTKSIDEKVNRWISENAYANIKSISISACDMDCMDSEEMKTIHGFVLITILYSEESSYIDRTGKVTLSEPLRFTINHNNDDGEVELISSLEDMKEAMRQVMKEETKDIEYHTIDIAHK